MTEQLKVWLDLIVGGLSGVLEVVEDVHLSTGRLGSDDVVALRHIARLIDLSRMVYLSLHSDALVLGSCLSWELPRWFLHLVASVL